jgi:hypothetical protein
VTSRPLAAAALACALGCSALHPRQPAPSPLEGEWGTARREATRRFALYDGLIHRATATATHLGLQEREAEVRRLAEWQGWTEDELARRLAQEQAEAAKGEDFLVAFYAANSFDNDLDAPRSVWRVALLADGGQLLPSSVKSVPADSTVKTLFPYVGVFDTVYRIRFPAAPKGPVAGRPFVLQIAGALGKIDLDFGQPDGVERADPPWPAP